MVCIKSCLPIAYTALDELADILGMDFNQGKPPHDSLTRLISVGPSSGKTHPMGVQMLEMLGFSKIDHSKILDQEVDGNTVCRAFFCFFSLFRI